MSQFATTTLATLVTELANRLQDPSLIFWSVDELERYLIESVRFFQITTQFTRQRASFTGQPNVTHYDLNTVLPAQFSSHVIPLELLVPIQYHFLEPALGLFPYTWRGTPQFNIPQITETLTKRRNQFLSQTGSWLSIITLPYAPAPPANRIDIPESIIDIHRVTWTGPDNLIRPLHRTSDFPQSSYSPQYLQSPTPTPETYSLLLNQPNSLTIFHGTTIPGQLTLYCSVSQPPISLTPTNPFDGNPISPLDPNTPINVPDDFSFYIKWGAMAELLNSDGQSRDPARAQYCQRRYSEGLELYQNYPSVLNAFLNDAPAFLDTPQSLDCYLPGWQSQPNNGSTLATNAAVLKRNIFFISPVSAQLNGIAVDCIPNIPIPLSPTDFIQAPQYAMSAIIDYAQHIACFKMAGTEFNSTLPLFKNALALYASINSRIRNLDFYSKLLNDITNLQSKYVPNASATPAATQLANPLSGRDSSPTE